MSNDIAAMAGRPVPASAVPGAHIPMPAGVRAALLALAAELAVLGWKSRVLTGPADCTP
jgi:hypothetical protein